MNLSEMVGRKGPVVVVCVREITFKWHGLEGELGIRNIFLDKKVKFVHDDKIFPIGQWRKTLWGG